MAVVDRAGHTSSAKHCLLLVEGEEDCGGDWRRIHARIKGEMTRVDLIGEED